jgi:hypothetical protein
MIVTTHMHTGEESQTVACDTSGCGNVLDPGERWADDAPWNDAQALSAAESRGWTVDPLGVGRDLCPPCAEARAA